MTDAIETLFVDLSVRTEKLESDVKRALAGVEAGLKQGLNRPVEEAEKKIIGMGEVFKAVGMSMVSTFAQTRDPFITLTSGVQNANVAIQTAAASGNTAAASIAGLASGVAMAVTGFTIFLAILKPVTDQLMQMAAQGQQLAARVDAMTVGLGVIAKNAGQNLDFVMGKVADLQKTGITTQESLQSTMQFLTQGLPIENIEKLARAGQDMAVAFGVNSTETFSRFVYAITTGNAEVLRMVGINKTASQMQEEFAAKIGKTALQLTELQKRQAMVDGIMQEATSYAGLYEKSLESVGKKMTSLQRYTEEATLAFGEVLLPILAAQIDVLTALTKAFEGLFVVMDKNAMVIKNGKPVFTDFGQAIFDIAKSIGELILKLIDAIEFISDFTRSVKTGADNTHAFALGLNEVVRVLKELIILPLEAVYKLIDRLYHIQAILDHLGSGVEAFKQIFLIAFATMAVGASFLADAIENSSLALHGKVMRSFDEMRSRARLVGKDIIDASLGVVPTDTRQEDYYHGTEDVNLVPAPAPPKVADPALTGLLSQQARAAADIIQQGEAAAKQAQISFDEQMRLFEESAVAARERLVTDTQEAISSTIDAATQARIEAEARYAEDLVSIATDANASREDENERYQDAQIQSEADFQLAMTRMQEDYLMNLTDAVQARDAKAVLQLMRQHSVDEQRALEDREIQKREAEEAHQEQLAEIDRQEAENQEALKESYEQQLKDIDEAEQEQINLIVANYAEQMKLLEDAVAKQRKEMQDAYDKQKKAMDDAITKQLSALAKSWADQGDLTEDGANAILLILQQYYGLGGEADQIMAEYTRRTIENAEIAAAAEIAALGAVGDAFAQAMADLEEQAMRNTLPPPGEDKRYAVGGFAMANRATRVTFGEAGPEAALFMPMNTSMGLSEFARNMAAMSGASGGSFSGQSLDLQIKLTSDSKISQQNEDQIFAAIAGAVRDVTRSVRRVR